MKHSPGFDQLCEDAKARIREVTIDQVKHKLNAGAAFRLIDVREDHEWNKDHAAGAEHLGRGIIERDIENRRYSTTRFQRDGQAPGFRCRVR